MTLQFALRLIVGASQLVRLACKTHGRSLARDNQSHQTNLSLYLSTALLPSFQLRPTSQPIGRARSMGHAHCCHRAECARGSELRERALSLELDSLASIGFTFSSSNFGSKSNWTQSELLSLSLSSIHSLDPIRQLALCCAIASVAASMIAIIMMLTGSLARRV